MSDKVLELSVSGNGIIFALSPYSLNAINARTGGFLWKTYLVNQANSHPAMSEYGRVYISDNKSLYALNQNNGEIIWQEKLLLSDGAVVDVSDKYILFNQIADLSAYNAKTGDFLWSMPVTKGLVHAYIDNENETAYIVSDGIHAVEIATGRELWQTYYEAEGLYENGIMFQSDDSGANAFRLDTKSMIWKSSLVDAVTFSSKLLLYKDFLIILNRSYIYVLQKDSGTINWIKPMEFPESPAVIDNTLFVMELFSGKIHSFDLDTGNETGILQIRLPSAFAAEHQSMIATNDLLVFSNGKTIFAYGK